MVLMVDERRVVIFMHNVAHWNISWGAGLLPPQEMLCTETLFPNAPRTTTTTVEQLFGFLPPIPALAWEHVETPAPPDREDMLYTPAYEDFSVLFAIEELAVFV